MLELDSDNIIGYLRQAGRLSEEEAGGARAELLSGGVSNAVIRVSPRSGPDFVVKQSRAQLRTKADWFSQPERIWRERDVIEVLRQIAPPGLIPGLLFDDRDNFLFAMEALPRKHVVWKNCLLRGEADVVLGRALGEILATIHARTADRTDLCERLDDRTIFDELRLDPFYRFVARQHPKLRPPLERLIDETLTTSVCLVLGDFSPKNILIMRDEHFPPLAPHSKRGEGIPSAAEGGERMASACRGFALAPGESRIALVDFETGHFGDPAFDLGFFLSHLLLKTIRNALRSDEFLIMVREFWTTYRRRLSEFPLPVVLQFASLDRRTVSHLAACLRARVDGKSTVDYLSSVAEDFVREVTDDWLLASPANVETALHDLRRRLKSVCSC